MDEEVEKKECVGCSAPFTPKRKNQRFHSEECRLDYYANLHKAEKRVVRETSHDDSK
jgi:hypothetical protein